MSSYAFAARVKAIDTAGPEMKRLSEKAAAAVKPEAKGLSEELDALALDVQNGRFSSSSANGPDYFDGVVGQWIDHVTSEAIYNGEEWQQAIADDAMAAGEDAAVGYHPVSQRLTRFLALMQQARELMGKSARGPIARKAMAAPGMTGEADDGDEAAVGSVTVVAPRLRRYRAVLVRSVNEQAVVEFDALETDPQHEIAEAVAANVPPEAWVRRESGCCGYTYLDKVEDIGPASGPVALPAGGMKSLPAPDAKGDVIDFTTGETIDTGSAGASANIATAPDVEAWAGLRLTVDDGGTVTTDDAYADFVVWCQREDMEPMGQSWFDGYMTDLGYVRQRIAGAVRYIGVTIS